MKLLFKQRAFTWFDSYDIYDENENTVYVVKGQLSWGHCLKIFDASEEHELGTVKEQIFSWWPQFELYEGSDCIGTLKKEPWGWFKPRYNIDFNGWHIEGDCTSKATGRNGTTPSPGRMGKRWRRSQRSCSTGRILMCWTLQIRRMRCMC